MRHVTTEEIPKHVMDNYNDKSLMEKVVITNEKSKKRHLERNKIIEGDVTSSQIGYQKLTLKTILQERETKERN